MNSLRRRLGHAAYLDVLYRYGPHQRGELALFLWQQIFGGSEAARAFELELHRDSVRLQRQIDIPRSDIVFAADSLGSAEVTVVVPLYNYGEYIDDALQSVRAQTLDPLDLIVVDDASTDNSLEAARTWAEREAQRFNRVIIARNRTNAGLARTRNAGFDLAETSFVVPLDADNRLLPDFCSSTLSRLAGSRAAFAYSKIQCFGTLDHVIGNGTILTNSLRERKLHRRDGACRQVGMGRNWRLCASRLWVGGLRFLVQIRGVWLLGCSHTRDPRRVPDA